MNSLLLALSYGASLVARGCSANPTQLADLIVPATQHRGFAFIHITSPCTEFNRTFDLFDSVTTDLPPEHDTADAAAALHLAMAGKVYLGAFHQVERPTFEEASRHLAAPQTFDAGEWFNRYQ